MGSAPGAGPRAVAWAVAAGLGLLAFAVRALPRQRVFVGEEVLPFGNDAWYHLRRILYSVERFPEALSFDRYINFPAGARPIWTPTFDWLLALVARPFFVPGDPASVERIVVWAPPVLGAATVVALHVVARRYLGLATATLSAALLAVLSAHFWYSQLGFVDHHAAVSFVSVLLLGASMRLVSGGGADERAFRRGTLGTGLACGAAILVWPGALLHVALAQAGLAVYVATRPLRVDALLAARSFAGANLVACVLVAPFAAGQEWERWGAFSPVVLSRFQPWLFGSLAAFGILAALLWKRPAWGRSRAARLGSAAVLGVTLAALALGLRPELWVGFGEAWTWLSRDEAFQASVNESMPLLSQWGELSLDRALSRLSGFVLVFPFAWLAAVRWAWRRPLDGPDSAPGERAPLLLWLCWAAGLFAATLAQRRFFNSFSVPFALVIGWGLCTAWRGLPRLLPRAPRAAWGAALVGLTLLCLAPTWPTYARDLRNELRASDEPRELPPWLLSRFALVEMGRWMSARTPRTQGWLDASLQPEYGVLSPWDPGHAIEYLARRPTVADNFGDDIGERNFRLAVRYWRGAEPAASRILDELGARYVVATLSHSLANPARPGSVSAALYPEAAGAEASLEPPAPLERHRLVYESRPWGPERPEAPPQFRVFEHVAGAQIVGRATPGEGVRASVPLRTNRPRASRHRAEARAGADGRFRLRVPYANQGGPPAVRVGEHYTLSCLGERVRVVVPEAAVRQGLEVAAPEPCR